MVKIKVSFLYNQSDFSEQANIRNFDSDLFDYACNGTRADTVVLCNAIAGKCLKPFLYAFFFN